ncbi:MAG: 8-amino-7-oxononanoate synthase [Microthrixaceae bacterium]
MSERWGELISAQNKALQDAGRWRSIRSIESGTPTTAIRSSGQAVISFSSNDYLGLSQHSAVKAAAKAALEHYGSGSGAARLIVGSRAVHDQLESALAAWAEREAALLFPTGFQANMGVIGALTAASKQTASSHPSSSSPANQAGCIVYSDQLNHASIIDGIRSSRSPVRVYQHCDVDHLASLISQQPNSLSLVVTDSVFSMDGDLAPLDDLEQLCKSTGAMLLVDSAHAVLGPTPPDSAVIVGTLSKTFGSVGGFVVADQQLVDLCINTARSFIFTTANSPADVAAAHAALQIYRSAEGTDLCTQLRNNIDLLRPGHPSPIIPVLLGSEQRAMQVAHELLDRNILIPAIRPPTVAEGTCRLRIAVSADHRQEDLLMLRATLTELGVDL